MQNWLDKIRAPLSHFRSDSDLEDEMRIHSELEADDYRAQGISEQEARRLTRLRLGDPQIALEKVRDQELVTILESWFRDIALGLRRLRSNPGFALTAIFTLALGIGANTAIFSLLYGLVLRSIPTQAPSRLAEIGVTSMAEADPSGATFIPYRMLPALRRELTSFSDISVWSGDDMPVDDGQGSLRQYATALVSGNAFEVIPVRPLLGRVISPFDDIRGEPAQGWPVVLGYGFWSDHFGKDRGVLGKRIRVSHGQAVVVGVMPAEFKGVWPGVDVKLYLPIQFANVEAGEDVLNKPDSLYGLSAIGRLEAGVSLKAANTEISHLQKHLFAEFIPLKFQNLAFFQKAYMRVDAARSGLPSYVTHTYKAPLYLMQGLVGIILLLCCVNVGGLTMTKVYARRHEFAVRTAIGAGLWRLVRQYLTEGFVIALAGSALGALIAWRGCDLLLHFFRDPMMGEAMEVHPDSAIFFAAGFLAVITTLLFGMLPAWRAGRTDPGELLKTRTSLSGRRHIGGRTFVPIQVAASLVLVALASLLSESILKLRSEETGFDIDHVTIQTSPLYILKLQGEARLNMYQHMVDRLSEMPDVRAAAVTFKTPMTGEEVTSHFQALGTGPTPQVSQLAFNEVGAGYFRTMKTPIVAGREFTKADKALNICVLNRSAAAFLFPHEEALGRYVRTMDDKAFPPNTACRVVGLAEDAKFSDVHQPPPPTIYFPLSLERIDKLGNLVFLINTRTKQEAISAFRKTISEIAPAVPLVTFVTLREQMDAALGSEELITLLSNFFGILALLLSGLGLYGLLSASVAQRTGEIGLRVALGADRGKLMLIILRDALRMVSWGVLLGTIVLVFAMRFVATMLHGVSAFDPLTLSSVLVVLVGVTLIAALIPAIRAASLDPLEALRAE